MTRKETNMGWKMQRKPRRTTAQREAAMADNTMKTSGLGIGEAGQVPASTPEDELEAARLQGRRKYDYSQGRKLSCGCTVWYAAHVMNASMGTSCSDCYDRMSDC